MTEADEDEASLIIELETTMCVVPNSNTIRLKKRSTLCWGLSPPTFIPFVLVDKMLDHFFEILHLFFQVSVIIARRAAGFEDEEIENDG